MGSDFSVSVHRSYLGIAGRPSNIPVRGIVWLNSCCQLARAALRQGQAGLVQAHSGDRNKIGIVGQLQRVACRVAAVGDCNVPCGSTGGKLGGMRGIHIIILTVQLDRCVLGVLGRDLQDTVGQADSIDRIGVCARVEDSGVAADGDMVQFHATVRQNQVGELHPDAGSTGDARELKGLGCGTLFFQRQQTVCLGVALLLGDGLALGVQ